MLRFLLFLALMPFVSTQDDTPTDASVTDEDMGPAAFMWPPDRVWSGDMDNKSPCGSRASVSNRTEFPLSMFAKYQAVRFKCPLLTSDPAGGAVALVAQDDYYNTRISISYSNGKQSTLLKLILVLIPIPVKILPRTMTSTL